MTYGHAEQRKSNRLECSGRNRQQLKESYELIYTNLKRINLVCIHTEIFVNCEIQMFIFGRNPTPCLEELETIAK